MRSPGSESTTVWEAFIPIYSTLKGFRSAPILNWYPTTEVTMRGAGQVAAAEWSAPRESGSVGGD